MQRNARNLLNLDQFIEMYDLKKNSSTSADKSGRRESKINKENINQTSNSTTHRRKLLNTIREETSHLREHLRDRTTVNFIVKNRANKLKFGKKIYEFYNAPITKYWQNTIIYILFLISFAYIVLVKTPPKPSIPELFVIVYIFSYGLDKIREVS